MEGKSLILGIILVMGIGVIDILIKRYIEEKKEYGQEEAILRNKIVITRYHNYGAAFQLGEKMPRVVKGISSILLGMLFILFEGSFQKRGNTWFRLGISFLLGGSISNVYDRIKRGYVVDYFSFRCQWKRLRNIVWNLGDMAILLGAILICVDYVKQMGGCGK